MSDVAQETLAIESDLWTWMRGFVAVKNEFYGTKFPPCPYALRALLLNTVDVVAWQSGDVRAFVRHHAFGMSDVSTLTTRVLSFPPRIQFAWGISDFVESLNTELIPQNLFLNTGVAKTTISRYVGSLGKPYFIIVVNSLNAVLAGAELLKRTDYYADWPKSHFDLVVLRRERMARRHGVKEASEGR